MESKTPRGIIALATYIGVIAGLLHLYLSNDVMIDPIVLAKPKPVEAEKAKEPIVVIPILNKIEWTRSEILSKPEEILGHLSDNKTIPVDGRQKLINTIKMYDEGRQWILQNISCQEYGKKLLYERANTFSGRNMGDDLNTRIAQVSDQNYLVTTDMEKSSGITDSTIAGIYCPRDNNVYIKPILDESGGDNWDREVSIHEFTHKATHGDDGMTAYAQDLLIQGFVEAAVTPEYKMKYLANLPTELYARKKTFDYDMERLGVKKYNETFTQEHYNKAVKLMREQKLSQGGKEFLIWMWPEYLMKIMNTVACTDVNDREFKSKNHEPQVHDFLFTIGR